jgi:ribose transport system ATP-binding protein
VTALLRVEHAVKAFPGLLALNDVSLSVGQGEILAVAGHNGSGKSTLIKALAGVHALDAGVILLGDDDEDGAENGVEPVEMHFIHQDLAVIDELTTIENLWLAQGSLAPNRVAAERARARELIARFGEAFDVDVPLGRLTPAQRAIVAIARALDGWQHPRNVIVLDEPTESLTRAEVDVLFAALRRLATEGAGVIFVSHRLDEVLEIADRVLILRDGRVVADETAAGLEHDRLVELITGSSAAELGEHTAPAQTGQQVLSVRGLTGGPVRNLDLDLFAGEIVGISGVLGSGREAVPAMLFGAAEAAARQYVLSGQDYPQRSPTESIRRGIGFVPGDRGRLGAVRAFTAAENITLPSMGRLTTTLGAVSRQREAAEVGALMTDYQVNPHVPGQLFSAFSGGNQQKIMFAKWLRDNPALLLLEEPTQGVDIGAKAAIYTAIEDAARAGAAVLVSSSDTKELLRICSRVIVLREGLAVAQLAGAALTENQLVLAGYGLAASQGASTS